MVALRSCWWLAVRLALTGSLGLDSLQDPTDDLRTARYRDDLDLVLADIEIGTGDLKTARRRLERVREKPAVPVSQLWARIGLAELARISALSNSEWAADEFWAVGEQAHRFGAAWLESQALLGVQLCGDPRARDGWNRVAANWPRNGGTLLDKLRHTNDEPRRVLWMVTL